MGRRERKREERENGFVLCIWMKLVKRKKKENKKMI
jgi:hypothetical protein